MTPIDDRDDMSPDMLANSDLELITDYLAKELPEEQIAEVRRRLETDSAFKDFAAPLIAAWSIPPHWERHPMPRAELEKHWDEFTKRAGFVHQRRKRRRRRWTVFGAVLVTLILGLCYFSDEILKNAVTAGFFDTLSDSGKRMTLLNGTEVLLDSGADFRVSNRLVGGGIQATVLIVGRAHFKLDWKPVKAGEPLTGLLVMHDRSTLATDGAEFIMRIRNDTADVEVIDRHRRTADSAAESVKISDETGKTSVVHAGERVALIRNKKVIHLPPTLTPSPGKPLGAAAAAEPSVPWPAGAPQPWEIHTAVMAVDVILKDGTRTRLGAGSRLRAPAATRPEMFFAVNLEGSARFRVSANTPISLRAPTFNVNAGKAYIVTSGADFAVTMHGDTVDLEVFRLYPSVHSGRVPQVAIAGTDRLPDLLIVAEGERARSIGGRPALKLPRESGKGRKP
jgi:ferric-dicitrate binding protein FerR (iron transport regulator)